MYIRLADGSTVYRVFCAANCAGPRAVSIELDALDLRIMRRMAENDTDLLSASLQNLERRMAYRKGGK